jgi:hypothetical protein
MGTLLSPLQLDATSGVGETLIVPEPERIVRFLIRSKGPPTGGEITIESCPMRGSDGLDGVKRDPRPLECDNRMVRGCRIWHFPCTHITECYGRLGNGSSR